MLVGAPCRFHSHRARQLLQVRFSNLGAVRSTIATSVLLGLHRIWISAAKCPLQIQDHRTRSPHRRLVPIVAADLGGYGDRDGDGFLEYGRRNDQGLINRVSGSRMTGIDPYRGVESDVGSYATAGRNGCGRVLWLPAASAPRSIAQ